MAVKSRRISVERTPVRESAESAIVANSVKKKNTVVVLEAYRQPIVRMALDAPPIKISDIECFRNAYLAEFIIPVDGGDVLKLCYGGDVPEPRYDIDAILAGMSANAAPLFLKLGTEKPNPQYNSEKKAESFWNSEAFMYSVIGVVCVFLVVLLFSGFRKIPDGRKEF
ncbi:MAG: hypothetical protein GXP32_10470 [Kiritimatiellaeota bacterium]|nr:hypothetical protein [Kiritimatiellota bacterium]